MIRHVKVQPNWQVKQGIVLFSGSTLSYILSTPDELIYRETGKEECWGERWRKMVAEFILSLEKVKIAPREKYL